MIVYNVTINIDPSIETEWLQWHKNEHAPAVMESGCFKTQKCFRLLEQDEDNGITFVTQYIAPDMEHYNRYISRYAPALKEQAFEKWGNRFIAFSTIMQVVN